MNVSSIYLHSTNDGNITVSICVNGKWYIAIKDNGSLISHYCELDNCSLGEELPLNETLNTEY